MQLQIHLPPPALRQMVQYFWTLEGVAPDDRRAVLLPTSAPEMIFNLNGTGIGVGSLQHTAPLLEWLGPLTRPQLVTTHGPLDLLGVRFFPHTAGLFVNASMDDFTDTLIALPDVVGKSARMLGEELTGCSHPQERLRRVAVFLQAHQPKVIPNTHHLLQASLLQLEQPQPGSLRRTRSYSPRYLQQLFRRYVGISPRTYFQIQRFHQSLAHLQKGEESLTQIAYTCGYSDQSHFIRVFKAFAGCTPLQFQKLGAGINRFETGYTHLPVLR
jgi:AraC-like DNA-binding protein